MAEQQLPYYLPETILRVHGTKRTVKSLKTGSDEATAEASIDLEIEADPDDYYLLDLDGSGLTDTDFTLEFTEDMRLESANATMTGRASAVLGATARVIGQLGGLAQLRLLMNAAPAPNASAAPPAPTAPVYPDLARLRAARSAATALSDRIVELGPKVADGTPGARRLLHDTSKALVAVRSELALIEAHYAAWKAKEQDLRVEHTEYRIPLRAGLVPAVSDLRAPSSKQQFSGQMAEMFAKLRMVVAHETIRTASPGNDPAHTAPGTGHKVEGIWFRRPYYTELVLMRYDAPTRWVEEDRTRCLVVTQDSAMTYLPLDRDMWGKRTLDVEFSALGMATKIATTASSGAAAAAAALAGVPSQVTSGLGDAAALEAGLAQIPDARLARAVSRLEAEQKLALAELGNDASADAALAAEVKRLEDQKKRLELLETLGRELD